MERQISITAAEQMGSILCCNDGVFKQSVCNKKKISRKCSLSNPMAELKLNTMLAISIYR